ncbi:MAG: endonuclease/exonuclease/phosphatase family protein [Pseudomonadota bacterium]
MSEHYLGFWNLENLFAPEGFLGRPAWIERRVGRDLEGWTEALFAQKISQLSQIITQMNGGEGPDILGVCEVENQFVLDKLVVKVRETLADRDYRVIHAESELDKRGIDTAFIYDAGRYQVVPEFVFSHFVLRRTGTRDILQATFKTQAGNDLIIMSNHWPSRSGGAEKSAGFRATAGETVGYWHERIREVLGPRAALIVMGDLNDDPWDPSVTFNANATRERGDVERAQSARLYNLSWGYLKTEAIDHRGERRQLDGTLYFSGNGNVFDQILVARPLLDGAGPFHLLEETAGIVAVPEMVSHRVSEGPRRFGLPRGDAAENVDPEGYSDHFPVSVILREDS